MVKKLIFIEIKKCINPKIIFAFCFFTIIFISTFFLYSISSTDVYVNEFSINAKIDGISAKRDAQAKIEKKFIIKIKVWEFLLLACINIYILVKITIVDIYKFLEVVMIL